MIDFFLVFMFFCVVWCCVVIVIVSFGIFVLVLYGLVNEFDEYGYCVICEVFCYLGGGQIVLIVLFGLVSYVCLIGFDVIGLCCSGKWLYLVCVGIIVFFVYIFGQIFGFVVFIGGVV